MDPRTVELMERADANGVVWCCWALKETGSDWEVLVHPVNDPGQPLVRLSLPGDWQPTPFNRARVGTAMLSLVLPLDQGQVPLESLVQLAGVMAQLALKDGVAAMGRIQGVATRLEHARVEVMACLELLADAVVIVLDRESVDGLFAVVREGLKQRPIAAPLVKKLESMVRSRFTAADAVKGVG